MELVRIDLGGISQRLCFLKIYSPPHRYCIYIFEDPGVLAGKCLFPIIELNIFGFYPPWKV